MPSRKIISVLILTSALVAGVILASGEKQTAPEKSRENFVNIVSEGDKNEFLNNTNWKQDLAALPMATPAENSASSTETLTEQVSRSLVSNYLALKQSGNLDSTSAEELVNQTVNYIESSETKKFTSADLIVSPDNSQEAVRRYGTELGSAFQTFKPPHPNQAMFLFSVIARYSDPDTVLELEDIGLTYHRLAEMVSKIQVPSSYAALNLDMINGLDKMGSAIEKMSGLTGDPLKAVQGINLYQESYTEIFSAISKIRKQIRADGVIYKQGESGYYFYYGI